MRRLPLAAGAVLLLAVGAGAGIWIGPAARGAGGAAPERFRASGWVETAELRLAFEAGGRLAEVLVAEGQAVEKGDVLARLDSALAEAQVRQAEAGRNVARLQLEKFDLEYGAGVATLQKQAEIAAVQAGAARLESQRAPAVAAAQLEAARAAEAGLQESRRGMLGMLGMLDLPAAQAGAAVAAAEAQYRRSQELTAVQLQLAEGQAALADQRLAALQAARDTNRRLLQEQAAAAEAALELARSQLARFTLAAPQSGRVALISARAGEVVAPGQPVVILRPGGDPSVKVNVPERALPLIQVGDRVAVTAAALGGRTYAGQVTWIGASPEYTPRSADSPQDQRGHLYPVRVQILGAGEEWRPGMSAAVEFYVKGGRMDGTAAR